MRPDLHLEVDHLVGACTNLAEVVITPYLFKKAFPDHSPERKSIKVNKPHVFPAATAALITSADLVEPLCWPSFSLNNAKTTLGDFSISSRSDFSHTSVDVNFHVPPDGFWRLMACTAGSKENVRLENRSMVSARIASCRETFYVHEISTTIMEQAGWL